MPRPSRKRWLADAFRQGTTPAGAETEQQASAWVRGMFGRIAPRYDLLNHLLSMNIDRYWRARTVSRVAEILARPGARVLDVCCGTGDLTLALQIAGAVRACFRQRFFSSHAGCGAAQTLLRVVRSRRAAASRRRCLARSGDHRLRISQSHQLSRRLDGAAAHLETRRHARDSGIFHASQRAAGRGSTASTRARYCPPSEE